MDVEIKVETPKSIQGIIDLNRNGNFCKRTYICKVIARAKVDAPTVLLKQSTGLCRLSVTASLLRLGALLPDNLQMGAFFSIIVCFYWLA